MTTLKLILIILLLLIVAPLDWVVRKLKKVLGIQ